AALLLATTAAHADPGTVAAKQAQAQQVLAQIRQIDNNLGAAVEAYNLANVRLHKIESDQRENRRQLKVAQANLKVSQKSLASRRQLLSSIKGQIARIKAAEAAQQRLLAAAARSRLAGAQPVAASGVGVSASTPEGSTVAPPNVHGGVVGIAMQYLGVPYVW